MKIIDVRKSGLSSSINEAVETLNSGGIVIYPTDTVYGLGADAENREAVMKVYRLKERPLDKPLTIAVCDLDMARKYAKIEGIEEFLSEFLPGPVTFILEKTERVIPEVNPLAIGIRIPEFFLVREMVRRLGRAVTSTSANKTSNPPQHSCIGAIKEIPRADLALDCGILLFKEPSTVVDLTGGKPKLIREGLVSFKEILIAYESLMGNDSSGH